jgi:membrane fusion protein (multidrug efflux system)
MRLITNWDGTSPTIGRQLTGETRQHSGSSRRPRCNRFALLLCLWLALTTPMAAVAASPAPGSAPPPLVKVAPAVLRNINPPAEYVGHVEAIQAVDLRARVEGFLEKLNFREGDDVRPGKLLYAIEQAPYLAKIASDKAQVAQAQAELVRAAQRLKRLRSALPESVPAVDVDDAEAAELRAKAQVAQAEAALTRSQLDLGYTTILAPIRGRIGRTAYTRGNLVGPASAPLARIVQMDPIRVVFSISENDLPAIQMALANAANRSQKPTMASRLRFSDGILHEAEGRIDFVDNEVDPATGTLAVRFEFDNPEGRMIPGQYVTVIVTQTRPDMRPVVAQAAVQQDLEGPYVLVVDKESRVAVHRVKTGQVIGGLWAIESGVSEGDLVIVEGIQKVQPGMTVKTAPIDNGRGR